MPANVLRPIRILVIEDDEISRKLIADILRSIGYTEIEVCADGTQGWTAIAESQLLGVPFDLVISDWDMPNTSGLKLLRKVRAQEVTHKLPFVLLTGHNERAHIVEAKAAGVTDYIAKPFTAEIFAQKLRKILQDVGKSPAAAK